MRKTRRFVVEPAEDVRVQRPMAVTALKSAIIVRCSQQPSITRAAGRVVSYRRMIRVQPKCPGKMVSLSIPLSLISTTNPRGIELALAKTLAR